MALRPGAADRFDYWRAGPGAKLPHQLRLAGMGQFNPPEGKRGSEKGPILYIGSSTPTTSSSPPLLLYFKNNIGEKRATYAFLEEGEEGVEDGEERVGGF